MQVLQNKVCRLKTGLPYDTPTRVLIDKSNDLSIHQLTAYHTLLSVHKCIIYQKPKYVAEKLGFKIDNANRSYRNQHTIQANYKLTLSRSGFIYRGAHLFNQLPEEMRKLQDVKVFKRQVKQWVRDNILIKPP